MEIQTIKISEQDRKLISDFMGEQYPIEIDFNWLMPVVEKIEKIWWTEYESDVSEDAVEMAKQELASMTILTASITDVFKEVINFIKFHNSQSPTA